MLNQPDDQPSRIREYFDLFTQYSSLASNYIYRKFNRFSISGIGPENLTLVFLLLMKRLDFFSFYFVLSLF